MTIVQAFLLGLMVAYTPSMIFLAFIFCRRWHSDEVLLAHKPL